MKITIRAVLINESNANKDIIDNMMIIFCTSVRYSFKRLLEGVRILDIEKDVARKYNLNSRQAKDAVESARQSIVSQKELVKMNYEDYSKKVKSIENTLNNSKNLSDKKKNSLLSKLDKRQRKLNYWETFIDTDTIPPVTFGTKKMFLRRCKGLI